MNNIIKVLLNNKVIPGEDIEPEAVFVPHPDIRLENKIYLY